MRYFTFSLLFVLSIGLSAAQDDIQQWTNANSHITIIHTSIFNGLTDFEKDLLGSDIIVVDSELSQADIQNYAGISAKSALTESTKEEARNGDASFIKSWIVMNDHVKLIKQSDFQNLTEAEQNAYLEHGALVMAGETLTRSDINNY